MSYYIRMDQSSQGRLFATLYTELRGLLIDYLRSRQAQKRGGDLQILPLKTDLSNALEEHVDHASTRTRPDS